MTGQDTHVYPDTSMSTSMIDARYPPRISCMENLMDNEKEHVQDYVKNSKENTHVTEHTSCL